MPVAMRILAERGAVVEVIHPSDRAIDLSTVRAECDLYVLKKTTHTALSLAGALFAQGARIVNPYPATVALGDKIVTARILEAAGVPVPASYVVARPAGLVSLLEAGPLVVKPYRGSGGFGVQVVRNPADLAALRAGQDPIFAQRYHAPEGLDQKIYCIGGRLFGVEKVFPATTQAEKHGRPFTPSPELCDIAVRCGRAFGIDLYGVDIILSAGTPYVVDMCSIPGFKGVPNAPRHLAAYFFALAQAASPSLATIP